MFQLIRNKEPLVKKIDILNFVLDKTGILREYVTHRNQNNRY